jgi:hypothetical protein
MSLLGLALAAATLQLAPAAVATATAPPTEQGWTPPRTSDGQPDFQGYWTNDTFTPLERPPELGNKEFFTEAEAAADFKKRHDRYVGQPKNDVHYDDVIWQSETYDKEPDRRTSLIFDPPNGRVPPLTPEAARRAAARAEAQKARPADGAESRSLAERCISWGNVGPPMLPPTYNANLQILQTRDYVIISHEMIHDARVIPLDGRPHLPSTIRRLAGDSVGRWEGDTLVVDTTNFTDKTNFRGAPRSTRQDIFASDALHVVERFTRVNLNRIRYQFTVDDPATWTSTWSGEIALRRFDGPLFEYACHEANYGLSNILSGARFLERLDEAGSRDAAGAASRKQ